MLKAATYAPSAKHQQNWHFDVITNKEKIEEILQQEKPNQKEYIKIHNEKIEKYIPSRVKESGNVEDFIIQCVQDYIRRERIKQERNSR